MNTIARLVDGWAAPAALHAALVGDDPLGFWLEGRGFGLGYIGSGDRLEPTSAIADAAALPATENRAWRGPGPFGGGWIGWFAYEAGVDMLGAARAASDGPPGAWLRVTCFAAIDDDARRIWAVAPANRMADWHARVADAVLRAQQFDAARASIPQVHGARARHTPARYEQLIGDAREAIAAGDAYQLCLTTRFSVAGSHDPLAVHSRLRGSAAPFTALIRAREHSLCAASPESFLRVTACGRVTTTPIKGTRPRHTDPRRDAASARALANDPKERAENLMIVDLMRNDLGRVCEPDSIRVSRLFDVESHRHVHQLVSSVTGRLAADATVRDLIASAFPAGSMTGAPKRSAIEILAALEAGPRGAYAGCFGWIGDDGAAELAMTIRSVVVTPAAAYVGAGGGITIDSDAAFEVSEVALKADAPLRSLGARLPSSWRSRLPLARA